MKELEEKLRRLAELEDQLSKEERESLKRELRRIRDYLILESKSDEELLKFAVSCFETDYSVRLKFERGNDNSPVNLPVNFTISEITFLNVQQTVETFFRGNFVVKDNNVSLEGKIVVRLGDEVVETKEKVKAVFDKHSGRWSRMFTVK